MKLPTLAAAAIILAYATTPLSAALTNNSSLNQNAISVLSENGGGISLNYSPSTETIGQLTEQLQHPITIDKDCWSTGWVVLPPTGGASISASKFDLVRSDGSEVERETMPEMATSSLVKIGSPVIFRGVRMAPVAVANLVEEGDEQFVVRNVSVEVEFTPGKGIAEVMQAPQQLNDQWYSFIESSVLNPTSTHMPRRDLAATHSSKMLILRPAALNNQPALQELARFAEWKRQTGLDVTVRAVDVQNTSPQQIRQIIAQGYPNDPYDYVLLIGWERTYEHPVPIENSEDLWFPGFWLEGATPDTGDYLYGALDDLDGDDDWMPDIMVGRMMVQDAAKLRGALNRTIVYEQSPYLGPEGHEGEWFNQAMVASDQSEQEVLFSDREMGVWVKNSLTRIGMNVDTLFVLGDESFSEERDRLEDWGASVVFAEGYLFGAVPVDDPEDYATTNGMNPLVVANSMWYGKPIGYPFFSSVEKPHLDGPIAWISTMADHYDSDERQLNGGVARALTQNRTNRIGKLYLSGILETLTLEPFNNQNEQAIGLFHMYLREFCLAGDPSVQIYTNRPVSLRTNLPATISPGATALNIRVTTDAGADVPNATVCIRQPNNFQYVSTTDGGGEVSFIIPDGIDEGALQVTVTKVNAFALIDTVEVAAGDVVLALASADIDDSQNGGDNDGLLDNGETARLIVTFVNNGEVSSQNVEAILSSSSPYVRFTQNNVNLDDIDSGGGSGTFTQPVSIILDDDCPGLTDLAIQIDLHDAQNQWLCGFEIPSSGPKYLFDPNGIGAQGLVRGANDATINLRLLNKGDRNGTQLNAVLVSLNNAVEVTAANRTYQPIAVNGSNAPNEPFHVRVSRYFAPGTNVDFELRISENNNSNYTQRVSIPVGAPAVGDPVGPDNYGYFAFDSGDSVETWPQAPKYNWVEINKDAVGGGAIHGTKLDLNDVTNWSKGTEESGSSIIVDLPFTFKFYGVDYDKLVVCSNGWVSFDTNAVFFRSPNYRAFPGMSTPDAQIAVCWQDLFQQNNIFSGIYTFYRENPGEFIIEWSDYGVVGDTSVEAYFVPTQFQLRLLDPAKFPTPTRDGEAVVMYKTYSSPVGKFNEFKYAAVGLRNQDGTDGLTYRYHGEYAPAAHEIHDGFAIKFTTMLKPEFGNITGRVVLAENPNNGIEGVHISHPRGVNFTTAADGTFNLQLAIGTYDSIRFDLPHHNPYYASVRILSGQETNLGDIAMTHPELTNPVGHDFDLRPDGSPTDRFIHLDNRGNGPLEFKAKIINADSTEPSAAMLNYVPVGRLINRRDLGAPCYRADTDSLYIPSSDPHVIRVFGLNGAVGDRTINQPITDVNETDKGLSYLTWDGTNFWGSLTMLDLRVRIVEFNEAGQLLRSFYPPFPPDGAVPILFVPERGTLFMTFESNRIYEVSLAEGNLGEMLNSWLVELPGETFKPTGLGWNPRDVDQCPLYVINWNISDSPDNLFPRRLMRLNLETREVKTWANLKGNAVRPIRGLSFIPHYDASHMAVVGIDQITGPDTLRFYDVGPRTDFLIGGLQNNAGIVPANSQGSIPMHFEATGYAEGYYSFAVKIYHNAVGDSTIIPVRMKVDINASVDEEPIIPIEFGIAEAFPNPFNSDLSVRFVTPIGAKANLKVFDLSGREVGSLYDGVSHGATRIVWNADDLPSGIYIVRLESGGRVDQLKAALIK